MVTASTTLGRVDINGNDINGLWLSGRKWHYHGRRTGRRHFDYRRGWRREAQHRRRRLLDDDRRGRRWKSDDRGRGGYNGGNLATDGGGTIAGWFEVETFLCAAIFALVDGAAKDVHFVIGSADFDVGGKRVYLLLTGAEKES